MCPFLKRISHRIAFTIDFYGFSLEFHVLAASDGLHELASYCKAGSCCDFLEKVLAEMFCFGYYLYIINRGAVIKCYELDLFVTSFGPYPTFGKNILSGCILSSSLILVLEIVSISMK